MPFIAEDDIINSKKISFILYAICAVIWTIRVILDVAFEYDRSSFVFILNILCALVWIVAAVVQYKRYRSEKSK